MFHSLLLTTFFPAKIKSPNGKSIEIFESKQGTSKDTSINLATVAYCLPKNVTKINPVTLVCVQNIDEALRRVADSFTT